MVYCGLFPTEGHEFEALRDALGKLQLNDAALRYDPDVSAGHPHACAAIAPASIWLWSFTCLRIVVIRLMAALGVFHLGPAVHSPVAGYGCLGLTKNVSGSCHCAVRVTH